MFTKFDKAGAAAIGGGLGVVIGTAFGLDAEVTSAVTVILSAILTYFVPNKAD